MDYDIYGEVINGGKTFSMIAEKLLESGSCIIGWTDGKIDHRDILFTYKPKKFGTLQRGLNWSSHLYISIIDQSCMGFLLESRTDNRKHASYIKEKLKLGDNKCDSRICDLINGVIYHLDKHGEFYGE